MIRHVDYDGHYLRAARPDLHTALIAWFRSLGVDPAQIPAEGWIELDPEQRRVTYPTAHRDPTTQRRALAVVTLGRDLPPLPGDPTAPAPRLAPRDERHWLT